MRYDSLSGDEIRQRIEGNGKICGIVEPLQNQVSAFQER